MYTGEDIKQQREAKANNIVKGFSNSDDLLEKAHNHGDVHSNGKWYWESSANGGKGDWRVIKKNKTTGQDSIAAEEVSETPIQRAQKARSDKTLSMKISYNNKVMTRAQFVEQLVKEGVKFEIAKVQAIKDTSRRVWNRMNMREQMEFEKKQKEAGMKDEYRAFFPDRTFYTITKAEYDYGQKLMSEKQNVTHVAKKEDDGKITLSESKKAAIKQGISYIKGKFYSGRGDEMEPVLYNGNIRFQKYQPKVEEKKEDEEKR